MDLYKNVHIYLAEDYFNNPKNMFFHIGDLIKEFSRECKSYLDVGCARGELNYSIHKRFPKVRLNVGVDLSLALVESGLAFFESKKIPVEIHHASSEEYSFNQKFDVISMVGLLPAILDVEETFLNARRHQIRGDTLLLTTKFNHNSTKTVVRYRSPKLNNAWQTTVTHAVDEIENSLLATGYKLEAVRHFDIGLKIPKCPDYPARAYTIETEDGLRHLTGYGQIFDIETIVAKAV